MKHINTIISMDRTNLKRQIMRRVYYSYALSFFLNSVFWQGVALGISSLLLAKWLHVASIVHNFLATPVSDLPQYVAGSFWGAITHGELLTAIVFVVAGMITVSVAYRLASALRPDTQLALS